MITSNLIGGLGNYMFQIATTYSLSIDYGIENIFNINDNLKVHNHITTYIHNILRNVNFVNYALPIINHYNEPFFHYQEIKYIHNVRLNGYFQSEKYFVHNREKILELYSIDKNSKKEIDEKYGKFLNENTCSLHVRRGDYLSLVHHHPPCDLDYYNNAIDEFSNDTLFLVFSDDINWCKEVFTGDNFIFIENNYDYIDLWLMSLCKNNIIANSSFSWWSAWLNKNENKKVIAPSKWFGHAKPYNTNDIIPSEWKKI